MFRLTSLVAALLTVAVLLSACGATTTQTYTVKTFDSKDAIDWDAVPGAKVNTYKWLECQEFDTTAKLVFVKDFGFVCKMTCKEANPFTTYTQINDPVYEDSCMEFFCNYAGDEYVNIELNSVGAACMQIGSARADRRTLSEILDKPIAITTEVKDDEWSVMSEMPIETLRVLYGDLIKDDLFVSGYTFSGNFYKTGGVSTGNEHYASWNEVGTEGPDFHQPAYFGKFVIE